MWSESDAVRRLSRELYEAFPEPNDLLTEPSCAPGREEFMRSMSGFTRDDIPVELLEELVWYLPTTIGTPQTLKHFLPKIFEESLLKGPVETWWLITSKLETADFGSWSQDQRRLTLAAMKLLLAYEVAGSETAFDATDLLKMPMADVVGLLDPYYGGAEPWWGDTYIFSKQVEFLVRQDASLGHPAPPA